MNKTDECKVILSLFQLGARSIDKECIKRQCRSGKAICLSEDQVFIANLIIDSSLEWDIKNGHIEILEENYPVDAFFCKGYSGEGRPLLHIQEDRDGLMGILTDNLVTVREWQKICEPISVMLGINSYRQIIDRKTLIHLCMNSQSGAILFRKVLMKVLELLVINWENELKMQSIAGFFLEFLSELSLYDDVHSELSRNIDVYREIMRDRVKGSRLDILYNMFMKADCKGSRKRGEKVDLVSYFSELESKRCEYYTSRFRLMDYIFIRRGMPHRVPDVLVGNRVQSTLVSNGREQEESGKNKNRIQEIIDLIAVQEDKAVRNDWIARLGDVFGNSVEEWIDEDVIELHERVNKS